MKTKLTFSTTGAWDLADGFGCASLGIAGICGNEIKLVSEYTNKLNGEVLSGSYDDVLSQLENLNCCPQAAVVLFGNAGGENQFMK